jgi:hypothetical protein
MAVSLVFLIGQSQVLAQDYNWLSHYEAAEKAYANQNLLEAKKMFIVALKEANKCNQRDLLAQKLEGLAHNYEAQDKKHLAEPLYKLLKKIRFMFH